MKKIAASDSMVTTRQNAAAIGFRMSTTSSAAAMAMPAKNQNSCSAIIRLSDP